MEFSRKEYWKGLPFPPPEDLPNPKTEPVCLCLLYLLNWQADSLPPHHLGFPGSSDGKNLLAMQEIQVISLDQEEGEGNGKPLQYSCLENSMDRPWGRKELDMIEQLTLSLFLYHCSTWEAKKFLKEKI